MFKFAFVLFAVSTPAFAAPVLNCWKVDFRPNKPFMSASIVGNNLLTDIRFNYRGTDLKDSEGDVKGELITSNRSPYKGNVRYFIKGTGELILPLDLSNDNLVEVEAKGIGYYKKENGVIISSVDGDGAGNHISYRLSCRSTK